MTTAKDILEAAELAKNGQDDGLFALTGFGVIVGWDGEFEYYRTEAQETGAWAPLTREEAIAIVAAALPAPKLQIIFRRREVGIAEAVQNATDDFDNRGDLEKMRAKAENQDAIIARMLMVQFGQYEDHFTSPEFEPQTDAQKLEFILGPWHSVVEA